MSGRHSDSFRESSVSALNLKNVNTNVCVGVSDGGKDLVPLHNNGSFTSGTEFSNVNTTEDSCDTNEKNTAERSWLVEGYEFLPVHLFELNRIPPPLVSSSWLKLLASDEESGEDSIPLSRLKKIIKKKKRLKKNSKSSFSTKDKSTSKQKTEKRKKKEGDEYLLIRRRRGRPKKQVTETTRIPSENEFSNDETEAFWKCGSDNSNNADHDAQDQTEMDVASEKEDNSALSIKYNEHDYFKPVETTAQELEIRNKNDKKMKKTPVLGVKIEDSKVSFPCMECGKSFSAASTLKCHQRIHNGTLLICPDCHKGFVSKYLLKCHMRIHNGDLFMCHKCGRGFTTAELLKVHTRAHTGDRPFTCNICGKSFPTSSNMFQHKQIHNSEKKFLCSQCGSSFVQKRCLDYHMLTHAEKKNICNVCGKLWARKSDLIEHMRVHTGVKPYCCNACPQKFSQASSLKRHQLVHMDIKPIQCVTCNKMFKCQEYYKRHLRKHKKDYLYDV